jgi:rRNA maturation protein Rpf1
MRNRVRYLVKNVLDELYTLGKNVKKGQLQREMKRLTNRKESHFIHTSTTKVRYERAMMKFCDYLEEVGIKRESHLKKVSTEELKEIIDDYFRQIVDEGYSKGTIKIHISAMKKSFAIIRPDIKDYLDEKRVDWWSAGQEHKKGDSYADPNEIREHLSDIHKAIAEAQRLGGFRVREIARAEVNREEYKITIHSAKGGRTRELHFEHRKEDFEKLVDLIEKLQERHYEEHLKDYYKDLKEACHETGQEYFASHGFRYEYAQNRIEELKENKEELKDLLEKYNADEKTKEAVNDENRINEACDFVLTRELGHNRSCMARYYYKR